MLMRPASALWDRHPPSVKVNLSPNVRVRARRGMEEAERKDNQHLPALHSRLQKTFNRATRVAHSQPSVMLRYFSPHRTP